MSFVHPYSHFSISPSTFKPEDDSSNWRNFASLPLTSVPNARCLYLHFIPIYVASLRCPFLVPVFSRSFDSLQRLPHWMLYCLFLLCWSYIHAPHLFMCVNCAVIVALFRLLHETNAGGSVWDQVAFIPKQQKNSEGYFEVFAGSQELPLASMELLTPIFLSLSKQTHSLWGSTSLSRVLLPLDPAVYLLDQIKLRSRVSRCLLSPVMHKFL